MPMPDFEFSSPPARALSGPEDAGNEGLPASDILPPNPPISATALAALAAAMDFADQALAPATLRAYRSDWQHFCAWCREAGWPALPAAPETIAAYLAAISLTHTSSLLTRRLAAMHRAHRLANQEWSGAHSKVRNTVRGIQRQLGRAPRQAAALATAEIKDLIAACGYDPVGMRDRAMFLIGYAGALRRSELVAIEREHVTFDQDGLRLFIPRGKGDQTAKGVSIGIPRGKSLDSCPVRALEAWLRISDCQRGPIFRGIDRRGRISLDALHPDAVRQILAKRATIVGLKLPEGERLSPHGLRAGFITQAYINGARDEEIMDHTRQKDLRTMRGYVRRAKLVTGSPANLLGL